MDAANIDLKGFTEYFYKSLCLAQLAPVLETLGYLKHKTNVWFEITTLLIPGENDLPAEIEPLSCWVMERLGPDVPLHFTAFHPDWKMLDKPATPASTLCLARHIARDAGVRYVFTGNTHDEEGQSTYCHLCNARLIGRDWYDLTGWNLTADGRCTACGPTVVLDAVTFRRAHCPPSPQCALRSCLNGVRPHSNRPSPPAPCSGRAFEHARFGDNNWVRNINGMKFVEPWGRRRLSVQHRNRSPNSLERPNCREPNAR